MPEEVDVNELRTTERYVVAPPIGGTFGATSISIPNLSLTGIQAEHREPLKLSSEARLLISIPSASDVAPVSVRGRVMWCRLSKRADEKGIHWYVSGIRFEEGGETLKAILQKLLERRMAQPERNSIEKKRRALREKARERAARMAMKSMTPLSGGVTSDQLLMIQHARARLASNPEEANKWYARARFSLSQESGKPIDVPAHYRQDVLAVWEYLERSLPLVLIVEVFEGHRR